MPIRQIVPGSKLMPLTGMSSQLITTTFSQGEDNLALPVSLSEECIGAVNVFGDLENSTLESERTDFSSFIALELGGTIVTFELLDGKGNKIADLDDNTFGIFFPIGFAPGGSTAFQELYTGFRIQWRKVLDLLGDGLYQIRITRNWKEITKTEIVLSCLFNLCQYTDERADETVRIETIQNGVIIGQGLNFRGLNWREQIRVPGFFGHKQRRIEQDDYLDKTRRTTQIQDSIVHEYTLEPYKWPPCLRSFIDEMILANNILINDYNTDNTDNLKQINVRPISIDTEYFAKSPVAQDEFKFEERFKTRIKRNVN